MDVHEIKIKKEDGKWSNSSNEMESQHHFPLQLETQGTTHTCKNKLMQQFYTCTTETKTFKNQ